MVFEINKFKTHYFYYTVILAVFVLLKYIYTVIGNDGLYFLLGPTNWIVKLATGSTPVYTTENGFYYNNLNILIEKSCSGYNFWTICFVMLSFLCLNFSKSPFRKFCYILFVLPISWILTLSANASRILTAIVVAKLFPQSSYRFPWLHQAEGIFIYLSLLILFYTIANYLFTKITLKNAEPV